MNVRLSERQGQINANLRVGVRFSGLSALLANARLSSPGVKLHGAGFIVSRSDAAAIGLGSIPCGWIGISASIETAAI